MLIVRTYVAQSRIHGTGLFAAEPIKSGQPVWVFNSTIDRPITLHEIECLLPAARAVALAHSFVDDDGRLILARDNGVFFNHSDQPNTISEGDRNIATRDIAAGEELTEDYRRFGRGACNEFLFATKGEGSAA
jgi:uncharacterized protein